MKVMMPTTRCVARLALAATIVVVTARGAEAQVFKVGSFTKSTGTAPASQTVPHNLGVTPKALILWTGGGVSGNLFLASYSWGFGVTDGTTSRSTSASSQNAKHTSVSDRRQVAKALTIVQYSGTTNLAEADLGGGSCSASWDATNFCLNWTTNNATAYVINFIAIGGSGLSAKVVQWLTPNPNVTGNISVTGVGFQPDVVLHFGTFLQVAPPSNAGTGDFMLGTMDAGGDQWATTFTTWSGFSPSLTMHAQRTDACFEEPYGNGTNAELMRGSFYSMDADGFTVNFTQNTDILAPLYVFSLALKGLNVHAGTFNKSTGAAPASQPFTGVGFQPAAVLLASVEDVTQPTPVGNGRLGIGAGDGTTQGSSGIYDQNGVAPTVTESIQPITQQIFMKVNSSSATTVDAQGSLTSLDADGFTLSWNPNDAVATEFVYLAFAPLSVTAVRLESFRATRLPDGRTRLEWRTGYEVDNVGFRLYREQNGQRVRITSSLIPGSALIGLLGRGASNGGRAYSWSDATLPPEAGPAQYWLEDVDLHGKSTWHGPIAATASPSHVPR